MLDATTAAPNHNLRAMTRERLAGPIDETSGRRNSSVKRAGWIRWAGGELPS